MIDPVTVLASQWDCAYCESTPVGHHGDVSLSGGGTPDRERTINIDGVAATDTEVDVDATALWVPFGPTGGSTLARPAEQTGPAWRAQPR